MKVKKKIFDRLLSCLGPSGANPEQSEIIEAIYGDELRWAGDVYGIFIHESYFLEPDGDDVYGALENLYYDSPDVDLDEREKKYLSDYVLSAEEMDAVRSCVIDRISDSSHDAPAVFVERIEYGRQNLFMFVFHQGDVRDPDYAVSLDGVFKTEDEAVKTLYSNGVFVD